MSGGVAAAAPAAVQDALREPHDALPPDTTGRDQLQALNDRFDGPWKKMLSWRSKWLTLSAAMLPAMARWCRQSSQGLQTPPTYATMVDSVALLAARTLSSGLSTKLSNPSSKWFGFTTTDPALDAQDDIEQWMSKAVNVVYAIMDRSNYYAATEQTYLASAVFALSATDIQPDRQTIIRCTTHPIGSYAIDVDERGRVNYFGREWVSTAFQLFGEFGIDNLPREVLEALRNRDRTSTFTVRHAVYTNEDANEEYAQLDHHFMPYRECYWLPGVESKPFRPLAEGFYAEWPVPAPRWGPTTNGEIYSSFSPGFIALPDLLMLYEMKTQYLNALQKQISPPTVSGGAFKNKKVWSVPGANNVDDQAQGDSQLRAMYLVNANLQHLSAEMEAVREQIRDAFYSRAMTPMLLRLQDQNEQPTALQAGLARDESYGMIGPIVEGFADQYHDLTIDRIFGIAWRAGKIDPPPKALQGKPLRVVLKSAMAQAQQAVGVAQLDRHLQIVGAVSSMWGGNALDSTDPDKFIKKYDQLLGVDPDVRRPDDERDAIRVQRVQAQKVQAAAQAAPQVAKAAKDITDARVTADIAGVTA